MKLTDNKQKHEIVSRLVKEGVINFDEAIILLELEASLTTPFLPPIKPNPLNPYGQGVVYLTGGNSNTKPYKPDGLFTFTN